MSVKSSKLADTCALCFSRDRRLRPISAEHWDILDTALDNSSLEFCVPVWHQTRYKLCWECVTQLHHAAEFTHRVQRAFPCFEDYLTGYKQSLPSPQSRLAVTRVCQTEPSSAAVTQLATNYATSLVLDTGTHVVDIEFKREDVSDEFTEDVDRLEPPPHLPQKSSEDIALKQEEFNPEREEDSIGAEDLDDYLPEKSSINEKIEKETKTKKEVKENGKSSGKKGAVRGTKRKGNGNSTPKKKSEKKVSYECRRCKETSGSSVRRCPHRRPCAPVKCDKCEKTYINSRALRIHVRHVHSAEPRQYCATCDYSYKTSYFATHFKVSLNHVTRDSFKYECSICHLRCYSPRKVREHMSAVHLKQGLYKCSLCPKTFYSAVTLSDHRAKMHNIGKKRNKPRNKMCHHCGKGFTSYQLLRNHVRCHTGEKPFKCPHCPVAFAQSGSLHTHVRAVHRDTAAAAWFKCEECGKEFATKYRRDAHYRFFHLRQSSFKCDECDKIFPSAFFLKKHNETRHGVLSDKSYDCDTPERNSNPPSAKEHQCRECDAIFKNPGGLYMHFKLRHLKLKKKDKVRIKNLSKSDKELIVEVLPRATCAAAESE